MAKGLIICRLAESGREREKERERERERERGHIRLG